ncbi:MAG: DUF4013 domain-containing protein [Halobacteriota archaeon]
MLGDALNFPRTNDDWLPTVVIGGVLSILSVLIIPVFIVQGYYVRVLRAAAFGDDAPSFTQWGDLLVDGVKLVVINLLWSLVIVVPTLVAVVVVGTGGDSVGPVRAFVALVAAAFAVVVSFFIPAAMTNFAVHGRVGAAFDVRTIVSGSLTSDYVVAWLLVLVVGIVGGLVGSALVVVLVGFLVLFYVQVVTYALFARGFAEGAGLERVVGTTMDVKF